MKILPLLLAPMFLLPFAAHADMLPDNEHEVNSCLTIDNPTDFPDYNFYYSGSYRWDFNVPLTKDKLTTCSKNRGGSIVAIKVSDESKLVQPPEPLPGDEPAPNPEGMPINAKLFLTAALPITFDDTLPNDSAVTSEHVTVHIVSIDNGVLTAAIVYTDKQDKNGNILTSQTNQSTPATQTIATKSSDTVDPAFVEEMILVVFGILAVAFAFRVWKK